MYIVSRLTMMCITSFKAESGILLSLLSRIAWVQPLFRAWRRERSGTGLGTVEVAVEVAVEAAVEAVVEAVVERGAIATELSNKNTTQCPAMFHLVMYLKYH